MQGSLLETTTLTEKGGSTSSSDLLTLQTADVWVQKALVAYIGDLQGKTVAARALLQVVSNEEFENLLDETEGKPTSQHEIYQRKLTMGFVRGRETDSPIVFIREGTLDGTVLTHEAIHLYAHPNWREWARKTFGGKAVDEGTTEYFTRRISAILSLGKSIAYEKWVQAIQQVVSVVSEEVLAAAYFRGETKAFEQVFLEKAFAGNESAYYEWFSLVSNEEVEQARLKMTSSVRGTVGSRGTLSSPIRKHIAGALEAIATGGTFESRQLKSWDTLVSETGGLAHPSFESAFGTYAVTGAARYLVRIIEPLAGEGKKKEDEEDAVAALVKATSLRLLVRAFLLGETQQLLSAHPKTEDWAYYMKKEGGLGLYSAENVFNEK